MRIAVDIRSTLKKEITGIGYYTLNLVNRFARIDKQNHYILYSRLKPFSRNKKLPPLPAENFRHFVDRLGLSPPHNMKGISVFYTSSFDTRPPKGAKFVVGVHDIIPKVFPQGHTEDAIRRLESELSSVLALADAIIVDAQGTAADLVRYYPCQCGNKITAVYPGVCEEFKALPKKTKNLYNSVFLKYNIGLNYIIYIGTLEPRKNIKGLIKAYYTLKQRYNIKHQLVIAGMKGWGYEDIFRLTEELGLGKDRDIIFTGYVPREELVVFYNFADVCVYPSFYEGAGLPVLEAFKCGCPVVTSNVSSMPEFAGNAAILTDPYSIDSIAAGIYRFLCSEDLRNEYSQRGIKRASEFTWARAAREILEVFVEGR